MLYVVLEVIIKSNKAFSFWEGERYGFNLEVKYLTFLHEN